MPRLQKSKWLAISCAALMSGCLSPPDLGAEPQIGAAGQYATSRSFDAPAAAWPSDRWWESYGDAQLAALIEEALADSPDLAIAAARVRRAQAAAQQSGAARFPTVGTESTITGARQDLSADNLPDVIRDAVPDDWSTRTSAAIKLDYQLDFFGRNRAAFAATTSQTQAAEAEAAAARLELSSAVALSYAELLRLFADRDAADDTVRMRRESNDLVAQRVRAGVENEAQAHQANSKLRAALAERLAIDAEITRTRHALAALLGKGPDRGYFIEAPPRPTLASAGLPEALALDLVGRRPDIVAARHNAEAAADRIDVARGDFYPNVNIGAVAGLQTLGLDRLGGGTLSFAQVGPAISLPIFSGVRIEGAYRGARADYDEAVALYDRTLINALREVADALSDRRALEAELVESRAALESAQQAYRLVRLRYEGGLASYIDTLTIEDGLVAQRRAVADLEANAFALDVAMVRALGGGFSASASTPS